MSPRAATTPWRSRGPSARERSDAGLAAEIRRSHARSRGTYGVPRVWADLAEAGHHVSRKRVARLMACDHLAGVHRRRFVRTTIRDEHAEPFPDLVNRDFSATGPDRLWVADITQLPTRTGPCYLAAITDAWSRRIVGWSMATHMRAELVTAALDAAVVRRRPPGGLIHHSGLPRLPWSPITGHHAAVVPIGGSHGPTGIPAGVPSSRDRPAHGGSEGRRPRA